MPTHTPAEKAKNKNFIQSAIKKPGSFTAIAKKAGAMTKKGTIKQSFRVAEAKKAGKVGQKARLAVTLSKINKRRKK